MTAPCGDGEVLNEMKGLQKVSRPDHLIWTEVADRAMPLGADGASGCPSVVNGLHAV